MAFLLRTRVSYAAWSMPHAAAARAPLPVALFTRAATVLSVLGALLFSTGCSDVACFEWTEFEGACPAQDEAKRFFDGPNCYTSQIQSVDSEGTFEDGACCYSVTNFDREYGGGC